MFGFALIIMHYNIISIHLNGNALVLSGSGFTFCSICFESRYHKVKYLPFNLLPLGHRIGGR